MHNENRFYLLSEDQLKFIVKEAIREFLSEEIKKVPYPRPAVDESTILTRKQAAKFIQVSSNTLTRYVRQAKLLPAVINGKYRFFKSDLEKFLKTCSR